MTSIKREPNYHCPYCSAGIFDEDWFESDPEEDYENECPKCGRRFIVRYFIDPLFDIEIPNELADCGRSNGTSRCLYWNDDDCCCTFPNAKEVYRRCYTMRENCPLGHKEEVDECN